MAQVATRDVTSDIVDQLTRPPYRAPVPDTRSPAARPFLALVWELTQRGWELDVEPGPNDREYLVAVRKGALPRAR